ncbi:MAG: hypothetical protein K2N63_16520, partial [Lachnospiraceae bacterium]|nr:hypothetical protein [Lachnospiraceae bacterium]
PTSTLSPSSASAHLYNITTIITQNVDGHYVQKFLPVREFINSFTEFQYLNLRNFETFSSERQIDYVSICNILNNADVGGLKISCDQTLTAKSHLLWTKTLQILKGDKVVLLYTVTDQKDTLLQVEESEKSVLLKGLSNYIPAIDYNGPYWNIRDAKRYAIPAFEGYHVLAVDNVPYGIAVPIGLKWHYIIAPFVREEAELRNKLSKTIFAEQIMSTTTFLNLIDYVFQNTIRSGSTKDEIRASYKQLIEEYYDTMRAFEEKESGKAN